MRVLLATIAAARSVAFAAAFAGVLSVPAAAQNSGSLGVVTDASGKVTPVRDVLDRYEVPKALMVNAAVDLHAELFITLDNDARTRVVVPFREIRRLVFDDRQSPYHEPTCCKRLTIDKRNGGRISISATSFEEHDKGGRSLRSVTIRDYMLSSREVKVGIIGTDKTDTEYLMLTGFRGTGPDKKDFSIDLWDVKILEFK